MSLDLTRPVQTRCGWEAEILATDMGGQYPVVVRFRASKESEWSLATFTDGGNMLAGRSSAKDLVNVPQRVTVDFWVNVFSDGSTHNRFSREDADKYGRGRIACFRVQREVEEGEGL